MNKKKSIFIWNRKQAAAAIVATAAILILTAFTAYGSGKDTLGITLGVLLGIADGRHCVLLDGRFGKVLSAMLSAAAAGSCMRTGKLYACDYGPGTADPCAESVVFLCAVRTADGADRQ